MIKELRTKINYSSREAIKEFTKRNNGNKDPHYTNPVTNPVLH